MAVKQITASVQNDGNYSQLDLQDVDFGGPRMRIETFRCSQPDGDFGATAAGTPVSALAGADHLSSSSNRVFRHVFSIGLPSSPTVTLEFRESFEEDGSCEVRCRDLDPDSPSFGRMLIVRATPRKGNHYHLRYDLTPAPQVPPALITSPVRTPVTELIPGLDDIGAPLDQIGKPDTALACSSVDGVIHWPSGARTAAQLINPFATTFASPEMSRWAANVRDYERFGDFRDKCVHPGINLRGPHARLASEYLLLRAYRTSMILMGAIFDPDMSAAATGKAKFRGDKDPLSVDPKPGVYSPFLLAHMLGIEVYRLGLDKVHSDYGGIPMKRAPGSRLENGIEPIADATRLNRTLAELAFALYMSPEQPALRAITSPQPPQQ